MIIPRSLLSWHLIVWITCSNLHPLVHAYVLENKKDYPFKTSSQGPTLYARARTCTPPCPPPCGACSTCQVGEGTAKSVRCCPGQTRVQLQVGGRGR